MLNQEPMNQELGQSPCESSREATTRDESGISRRAALAAMGGLGLAAAASLGRAEGHGAGDGSQPAAGPVRLPGWDEAKGEYVLADLPYAPEALEPYIDAQTMMIHHGRHHGGYVRGLNTALKALDEIRAGTGDPGLIKHWTREVSFHGSGHVNHTLFWQGMAPAGRGGGERPTGILARRIDQDFRSFEQFVAQFKGAANAVEGSGWGWLVLEPVSRRLLVLQGEKQQDLMLTGVIPILGVDVWEHAYYLKYQNRRGDYLDAFMSVVNWPEIGRRFEVAWG